MANAWNSSIILDNGAYCAKIGHATDLQPRMIPNCIIKAKNVRNRIFIGDQIDDCKDLSGLYYLLPFQKGYLVNWEIERQVWDHMFGKDCLKVDCEQSNIVLTEPFFNFSSIQEALDEILFEDYHFQAVLRCNAGWLSQYKYCHQVDTQCCLVVDSGYSFTYIVPYCNGRVLKSAIRRINVGGKVLTNHLKEVISYRQLMVMDETHVVNQMKEDTCFVSIDFNRDMEIARKRGAENTVARDYVLPDYTHIKRGYVRPLQETSGIAKDSEQIICMNNERFALPEVLFHPSDIGIQEMGIPEAIVHVISQTSTEMQPHFYSHVVLTGGNCQMPGFKERVYQDLRSLAPDEFDVHITCPENPTIHAWQGGVMVAKDTDFSKMAVTKQQYDEHGHNICIQTFDV